MPTSDGWLLGGFDLYQVVGLSIGPKRLRLTCWMPADQRDRFRDFFGAQAGKLTQRTRVSGAFVARENASTGLRAALAPPAAARPPFRSRDVIVAAYDDRPLGQGAARYEVQFELHARASREPTGNAVDQTPGSDDWALEFSEGTIATPTFVADDVRGDTLAARTELDGAQLTTVLDSASYPDGATLRRVPGGDDYIVDNSTGARQTIRISLPDSVGSGGWGTSGWGTTGWGGASAVTAQLPQGQYVLESWEATRIAPDRYELTLEGRPPP
jgi:hypothetical protein